MIKETIQKYLGISTSRTAIENKMPFEKCEICIGSNARIDELGYHANVRDINALKGSGKNIKVIFELDAAGYPINVSAKAI